MAEAVDVLTDQARVEDFLPDDGRQIENTGSETVWFWYNPSLDSIVQEEIAPYDIRGGFGTKTDAGRFPDWFAEQYGVVDTSYLELYSAAIQRQGFGRKYISEEAERSEKPPKQVDFDTFRPDGDDESEI